MKSLACSITLLGIAFLLAPLSCGAYETDQLSDRLDPISDSTDLLDERVNQSIADAIADWKGPRKDARVVSAIYHDIGGVHWVDKIERWAMKSEDIERLQVSRYDSIYRVTRSGPRG